MGNCPIVVEPSVWATILVDVTPGLTDDRRIGGHPVTFDESRESVGQLKIVIGDRPIARRVAIENRIGKKI